MLQYSSRPQNNSSRSLDCGDTGTELMIADRSLCPRGGRDTVPLQVCKQNLHDWTTTHNAGF